MTVLLAPPNILPHIGSIFAYLSVDERGNEGVCAAPIGPGGMTITLIAADRDRLVSITPVAESLAAMFGMTIKLVEFTTRVELREITGPTNG